MDQKKYDVFISYSRKDYVDENANVIPGNIVSKVKNSFKAAGISYWFDEEGIYSGDAWAKKILNSIKASRIFVFIASENANKSPFTRKEIASADEFHISILPFRLDNTPYDDDVLFRIVDLQYIAYYKNPDTGLEDLVEAVKSKLEQIKEEEEVQRKKKEEEHKRRQVEEEIRKRKEQQQKDIEAIRLACSKLNNEETKTEVDRSNLLLEVKDKVKDLAEQEKLMNDIISSSPIRKKSEQQIRQLKYKIESLENGLKSLQQEKESLDVEIKKNKELLTEKDQLVTNMEQKYHSEVERLENQIAQQQSELTKTKEQLSITEQKQTKSGMNGNRGFRWWIHLIYVILLVSLFCAWFLSNSKIKELRQQLYTEEKTINTVEAPVKTDTTITPTTPRQASEMEINSKNLKKYLYTGPLNAEGKPEGKGRALFPNKDTFEGTFVNGMLVEGRYTFAKDGTYFLGAFNEKEEPDIAHGAYYNKNGKKIE